MIWGLWEGIKNHRVATEVKFTVNSHESTYILIAILLLGDERHLAVNVNTFKRQDVTVQCCSFLQRSILEPWIHLYFFSVLLFDPKWKLRVGLRCSFRHQKLTFNQFLPYKKWFPDQLLVFCEYLYLDIQEEWFQHNFTGKC